MVLGCAVPPAGAGTTSPTRGSGSTIAPLPFLHVVTPTTGADRTPYLADPAGRQVLLHGVAAVGMQDGAYPGAGNSPALFPVDPAAYDGRCPSASPLLPQPPLCEVQAAKPAFEQSVEPGSGDDFAQMRALGFDVVRLVLDWSQLEPTPGRYSAIYLARIAQVVGWARQQGIYVILDMHQDAYSRFILPSTTKQLPSGCKPSGGQDGAPRWAVITDGKPACALFGQSDLNPAVSAAFFNFWNNARVDAAQGQAPGSGLEDHYIGALAALAHRFEHDPAVLGYELMNEPLPGSLASLPVANLYQASAQELYPFYRRAIEALTGVRDGLPTCPKQDPTSLTNACAYPQLAAVHHQQIFFEPLGYRNLLDFSPQVSTPFSAYPNLVYAPHVYTHTFTVDQFLGYSPKDSPYPPSYEFGYQTAESEAQAMHAAVLVTEFGDASATDNTVLRQELEAQDETLTGATLWAWKGLSAHRATCWCVRWQHSSYQTTSNGTPGKGNRHAPVSPKDTVIASRQLYTARVWPRVTAGRLLAYNYDPASGSFVMVAQVTAPDVRQPSTAGTDTIVYVPPTVHGAVNVSGSAVLERVVHRPDASRLVEVAPAPGRRPAVVPAGGPTSDDTYSVSVGAPSTSQLAAVSSAATAPAPPIGEPEARQQALQALALAMKSSNAGIRSKAGLASALATLLLGSSDPASGPSGA